MLGLVNPTPEQAVRANIQDPGFGIQERAQVALLTVFDRLPEFWALLTLMGRQPVFPAPPPSSGQRYGWRGGSYRSTSESQLKCVIILLST